MSDWPMTREDADANGLCRHKTDWREHCDGCEGDLRADNARLRALVKDAERNIESECSWCGADRSRTERNNDASAYEPHAAHCPAFTPDGVVK